MEDVDVLDFSESLEEDIEIIDIDNDVPSARSLYVEEPMDCSNLWAVSRKTQDPEKEKLFKRVDDFILERYSRRKSKQRSGNNLDQETDTSSKCDSMERGSNRMEEDDSKNPSPCPSGTLKLINAFNLYDKPLDELIKEESQFKKARKSKRFVKPTQAPGGNEFRRFSSIMHDVNRSYLKKRYTDVITQMKMRDRKLALHRFSERTASFLCDMSSDSSDDEEIERQEYMESILFQKVVKSSPYSSYSASPSKGADTAKYTNEYWDAVKCFRYLELANMNCSLIFLIHIRKHFNFHQNVNTLRAVMDCNALSLLFNLLETEDIRCQVAVMKLLRSFVEIQTYCRKITFIGGVQILVNLLKGTSPDLRFLAAHLLSRVCYFKLARDNVAKANGIPLLVQQLDMPLDRIVLKNVSASQLSQQVNRLTYEGLSPEARCVQSAAEALWSMSRSVRHRIIMRQAGMIPLLAKLMKANNQLIMVPIIGVLQQCSSEATYRVSIRTEGMIPYLVMNMCAINPWLNTQCALTLFKCAEDNLTREQIRIYGGLEVLHEMLDTKDEETLIAVTGAIWKCCISPANASYMQQMLKTAKRLIKVLLDLPNAIEIYVRPPIPVSTPLKEIANHEKIMEHSTGALSELAKLPEGRNDIRLAGGINLMIHYLDFGAENSGMLVNVCRTLAETAVDKECLKMILEHMGMRKLVSLLKSPNPLVLSSAAWSLAPCIRNTPNAGVLLRHFVGFLELIANLLDKANEKEVLISVCAVIAEVAKDDENLAVLADHGIVQKLSRLVYIEGEQFRMFLSEAIACCARHKANAISFGRAGVVLHLVNYLKMASPILCRSTVRALHSLSCYGPNCYEMKQAGMAKLLAQLVGSDDRILQDAAAKTIVNIRRKVG